MNDTVNEEKTSVEPRVPAWVQGYEKARRSTHLA